MVATTNQTSGIGAWRVVIARTSNDATVASFECSITKLGRYVSPKVGDLEISIPIPNADVGRDAYKVFGGEGRLSMYAYRGNDIWWGGFVDGTEIDSGSATTNVPTLTVHGASFESYPDRREGRTDESLAMDQTAIAKWLWDYIQSSVGGYIRVETPTPRASGVPYSLAWKRSDTSTVGALLKTVSNRVDGFEWIIDVYQDDAGLRRRELVVGYPIIGRPDSGIVMTYPGNVLDYKITGEALDGATSFQSRGKAPSPVGIPNTSGSSGGSPAIKQDPIMSDIYTNNALIQAGYTLTDTTIDRSTVTDVSVLNDWASLALSMRSGPLVLPSLTCRMEGFNQAILGSNIRVKISDFPFPAGPNGEPGWASTARVIGYEVSPGEFGSEDVISLIFENPYDQDSIARSPE